VEDEFVADGFRRRSGVEFAGVQMVGGDDNGIQGHGVAV
jgi:hypothetical protein